MHLAAHASARTVPEKARVARAATADVCMMAVCSLFDCLIMDACLARPMRKATFLIGSNKQSRPAEGGA